MRPHTTRLPKEQEDQKGNRGEGGGGSITLLSKRVIRGGEKVVDADDYLPWC